VAPCVASHNLGDGAAAEDTPSGPRLVDPARRKFHTAREPLDQAALATGGPGEDESARVR
jgi:hypothetical protein